LMLPLSMLSLCRCYSFDVNFFEVDVPVVDVSYFPHIIFLMIKMRTSLIIFINEDNQIHFWFRAQKVLLVSEVVKCDSKNNHLALYVKIHDTLCRKKVWRTCLNMPKSISPQKWQNVGVLYEWMASECGRISTSSSLKGWELITNSTSVSSWMSVTALIICNKNKEQNTFSNNPSTTIVANFPSPFTK